MRAALKVALADRLSALGEGTAADPPLSNLPIDVSEEALRYLSVPLRGRLRERRLSELDQALLSEKLGIVFGRANWQDLRYLDAFNVLYESWPVDYLADRRQHFLSLYRAVLLRAVDPP